MVEVVDGILVVVGKMVEEEADILDHFAQSLADPILQN